MLEKIVIFLNLSFDIQFALNNAHSLVQRNVISPLVERNLSSFFYSLMLNHSLPLVDSVFATKHCETGIETGNT